MIIDLDSEADENSGEKEIVNDFDRFKKRKEDSDSENVDDEPLETEAEDERWYDSLILIISDHWY